MRAPVKSAPAKFVPRSVEDAIRAPLKFALANVEPWTMRRLSASASWKLTPSARACTNTLFAMRAPEKSAPSRSVSTNMHSKSSAPRHRMPFKSV